MRRNGDKKSGMRRTGFAALFARVGLWLAAFALLSQSLAVATPPMFQAGDARSAAAELSALLGPGVVVCTQSDDPGAPLHPDDCRDQCPICQVVANAAVLSLPTTEPLPAPAPVAAAKLDVAPQARLIPAPPPGFSLARGPPSLT